MQFKQWWKVEWPGSRPLGLLPGRLDADLAILFCYRAAWILRMLPMPGFDWCNLLVSLFHFYMFYSCRHAMSSIWHYYPLLIGQHYCCVRTRLGRAHQARPLLDCTYYKHCPLIGGGEASSACVYMCDAWRQGTRAVLLTLVVIKEHTTNTEAAAAHK